ncbi:GNAT family N-acetyltransferase [Gordonia pseudamarae]|uniref:GNAT family N-acetyltransferase n=1 Tax=Gordonia pseudamarae TaxID=2831662 RepID=A0ABX6IET6_9ACTN|nr:MULTISPECIES: GNAT family N-acetyltransferase [Gordonia]MBD0023638.1 GNAT family N-acetyltransferase [Gordonia sp. (in: high G+C Gram-positive bacteria)]QHN25451.1 GNAT family N-acetyltransferase [Gordonia pseudamarae]QHN34383.1 GNAT family N-acetyltransferase [Gordonia pseudamarae]
MSTSAFRLELHRATESDWPDIFVNDARAFLQPGPPPAAEQAKARAMFGDGDVVVVRDPGITTGQSLAGVAAFYRMRITVPGTPAPVARAAGLSWVSVAATHRRRGVLRAMMSDLFDQWEAENFPFAILTATEATIYERFGFGPACLADKYTITLDKAHLRAEQDSSGAATVTFAAAADVMKILPALHDRWTSTRPGAVHRDEPHWRTLVRGYDAESAPHRSAGHYLLHRDGYAHYRTIDEPENTENSGAYAARAEVDEFFATTDEAHRELWRVLLNLDLVTTVSVDVPTDDPLPLAVTDMRSVDVTGRDDKLWLRILDVPAALTMRGYRGDLDVVIDVEDRSRDRGGTFRLQVSDGVAQVSASSAEPVVRLDISVLASLYLGAFTPSMTAAAGRLWTAGPDITAALDRAWATDRAPFAGTYF